MLRLLFRPFLWLLGVAARPRRHVFKFTSDGRDQYRDPVELRRRLNEADPTWAELVDQVVSLARPAGHFPPAEQAKRQAEADAGTRRLADLVCTAFGVRRLDPDGTGMTEPELIGLMEAYLLYAADAMRATRPL